MKNRPDLNVSAAIRRSASIIHRKAQTGELKKDMAFMSDLARKFKENRAALDAGLPIPHKDGK